MSARGCCKAGWSGSECLGTRASRLTSRRGGGKGHPAPSAQPAQEPLLARTTAADSHSTSVLRRFLDLTGWIIPAAGLALLPKCPACLAAYVALGTGVGLSFSTATYLRTGLILLFLTSLSYLAVKTVRRVTG